jgi:hypothetical protein
MPAKKKYSSNLSQRLECKSQNFRDIILLLEIGAFLHDLGKLSPFFIMSKAKGALARDFHGQIIFMDLISESHIKKSTNIDGYAEPSLISSPLSVFLFMPIYRLLNIPRNLKGIDLSISLSHLICAHHGCSRCLYGLAKSLLNEDFPKEIDNCEFSGKIDSHPLIALLKTVDHLDASNPSDAGKQGNKNVMIDNFFYEENEVPLGELNRYRKSFYRDFSNYLRMNHSGILHGKSFERTQEPKKAFTHKDVLELNRFVKLLSEKYFSSALSETRRYGNDITLLDHARSVAACFKMYLFNYLVRDRPMPDSFFSAQVKVLKIWDNSKEVEERLSYELACSNLVFMTDNYSSFLLPDMRTSTIRNLLPFDAWNKLEVEGKIILSEVNDFSIIFDDTFRGQDLQTAYMKLREMEIKSPEDFGFTMANIIRELKRVILFSTLKKKETLDRKLRSGLKHLENLKNGTLHDEKNLLKYYRKENSLNAIRKHLDSKPSINAIRKFTGWKSSKDAEKEVYDFFNIILSPIRPPSPIEMSNFFLKEYRRLGSLKKLYNELVIRRPLTPGRIYAFTRNLVKFIDENN